MRWYSELGVCHSETKYIFLMAKLNLPVLIFQLYICKKNCNKFIPRQVFFPFVQPSRFARMMSLRMELTNGDELCCPSYLWLHFTLNLIFLSVCPRTSKIKKQGCWLPTGAKRSSGRKLCSGQRIIWKIMGSKPNDFSLSISALKSLKCTRTIFLPRNLCIK